MFQLSELGWDGPKHKLINKVLFPSGRQCLCFSSSLLQVVANEIAAPVKWLVEPIQTDVGGQRVGVLTELTLLRLAQVCVITSKTPRGNEGVVQWVFDSEAIELRLNTVSHQKKMNFSRYITNA